MDEKDAKKIIGYWRETSEHDFDVMNYLFRGKRYSDSLFYGHIALEKILKALVVKTTQKQAPYTHDLVRLAKAAKLVLSAKEADLLDIINEFNIRARYPELKLSFYKKCTKAYAGRYIKKIELLYKDLCQRLKQKK